MRPSHEHVVVIGGGFVGQLVQLLIPHARLLDAKPTAPADHLETRVGPQYLWEPVEHPGVTSESFVVLTLVDDEPPTPESILAYKQKIGKEHDGGDWGLQFQHITTGWHSNLPVPNVEYDTKISMIDLSAHRLVLAGGHEIHYDVLINTIPLPLFLKLCTVPPITIHPWRSDIIFMDIVFDPTTISIDGMMLNYLSSPKTDIYRETHRGQRRYYETLEETAGYRRILPGKIHGHPESEMIVQQLQVHDCFCFGRFATWRPDELAHITWKLLQEWMER